MIVWPDSKQDSWTALARLFFKMISSLNSRKLRKIVPLDVRAAISIVLNQHQLRKLPQLPFLQQPHHQLEMQSLCSALTIWITNPSLLISTVFISHLPLNLPYSNPSLTWHLNLFLSGNMNEDLTFEYGADMQVSWGCAATLKNEFWYFGGCCSNKRQVYCKKYSFDM